MWEPPWESDKVVQEQGTGGDQNAHMARNARRQAGARRKAGWRLSRAVTPPCGCFWRPPYSMIIDLLRMGSKCCFLAEKPL